MASTVTVDFLELDHMRQEITAYCVSRRMRPRRHRRRHWDASGFYVGRRTVHFYFRNCVPVLWDAYDFMKRMNALFGREYEIAIGGADVHFYLKTR